MSSQRGAARSWHARPGQNRLSAARLGIRSRKRGVRPPPRSAREDLSDSRAGWTSRDLYLNNEFMKSAYELAMERLNKSAPAAKLTAEQKKQLAELDSKYAAKIAEREIFLKGELTKATANGD